MRWLIFWVFLTPVLLRAQTSAQFVKAGDKKFADGDYYAASLYYKSALKKDQEDIGLNYKYAEAARMFNDYKEAAEALSKVVRSDEVNLFPLATFWYGEMLKCSGQYDEAVRQFRSFRSKYRKKDFYIIKAQQEIESCLWARDHLMPNGQLKVNHLGKDINTGESEFNPIPVFPERIQFSSLRNISSEKKQEKYLVRIYNQLPNPEKIFMPQGVDETKSIGNGNYSPDSKMFYFTQCEQRDKTTSRCDIYVSRYENYKWGPAEKLSDHVNDPKATNTHPSIGYDLSGSEILFFASDREGGLGGMDIWMCKLSSDGTYQNAVNAGDKVNSPGNEVTPFYAISEKKMYFSSDWHYGFGGYDIFETSGESVNWTQPQNILQPVNSTQNDLYYAVAPDGSKAYLSSNRKGSYFIEAETCCNDIYAIETGKKVEKVTEVTLSDPKKDSSTIAKDAPNAARVSQGKADLNDELRDIRKYLPVTLYFHNDEPDCCNLRDTTLLDYKQTYESYTGLLNEYQREFAKGLIKDQKVKAENEIYSLFNQKIDKGYYDLVAVSARLLDLLEGGNKVEITIGGYCSPLNNNDYNIHLGYRRVASLKNYFFHYRGGIFLPYLQNGALFFRSESLGEETSPKGIGDNRLDKRNSVYHPDAALERRVQITSVELK